MALIGSFWMIIPIYGWAKYNTMMGLLARLAYGELVGNPKSVVEAKRNIKPKMWSFLNLGWKVNWHLWIKLLFLSLKIIAIFIAILCIISLISVVFSTFSLHFIHIQLLSFIASTVLCVYYYLFASRLHLYELPLVVETNINIRKSIDFSEQLVEKYSFSTLVVIFVFTVVFTVVFAIFMFCAGVVINPLSEKIYDLIANIPVIAIFLLCLWLIHVICLFSIWLALVVVPFPTSIFLLFQAIMSSGDKIYIFSMLYLSIVTLFIPLWQSIKAIIYYHLKLRNEYRSLLPERST
ncbi:MAG: hypothetical protein AAGF83_08705 [Cyanobacteria bacterium P01_G01_bin.67]